MTYLQTYKDVHQICGSTDIFYMVLGVAYLVKTTRKYLTSILIKDVIIEKICYLK